MKAFHGGGNFGEAESIKEINVLSDCQGSGLESEDNLSFDGEILSGENGNVTIEVSSHQPYAVLMMKATARYITDTPLEEGIKLMIFYADYVSWTGFLGTAGLWLVNSSNPYVYEAFLTWSPHVIGVHKLIGGVFVGDGKELVAARENGTGIIAFGDADLDIQRCPLNVVLGHPEAVYEVMLPLTVSLSKPRPYQTGFVHTLAPSLTYNGVEYVVDEPVSSLQAKLHVNKTLTSSNLTVQNGLASFLVDLNLQNVSFTLNITATVDEIPYESKVIERFITFSRVTIQESAVASDAFRLNYTFERLSENGELYVGVNNTLNVETSLFNQSIWGIPVSVIIAKFNTVLTTSGGNVSVPSGLDYLRVVKLYEDLAPSQRMKIVFDINETVYPDSRNCCFIPFGVTSLKLLEEPLLGDANGDGKVEGKDAAIVAKAYNTKPGDPNWDPRADLNGDGKVDGKDNAIVSKYYGDTSALDADIEFLRMVRDEVALTDNLGLVDEVWESGEVGRYLVQVKLPLSFNVTATFPIDVTEISASVNIVNYFDVVKRPVNFTIDLPSEFHVETIEADADAYVESLYPSTNNGNCEALYVGFRSYHHGEWDNIWFAYIRFNVSSVPEGAHIISARLNLFLDPPLDCLSQGYSYEIYRVTSSWEELGITWSNQPTSASSPSYVFSMQSPGWLSLDVTDDVRMWHNGSATNFGLVLKRRDGQTSEWFHFLSREYSYDPSCRPALEVSYVSPSPVIVANAYDNVAGEPISALPVQFSVNGVLLGNVVTNISGVAALAWRPTSNIVYNVTVSSLENATYRTGVASSSLDFRFPTNITSLDGDSVDVGTGINYIYDFELASSSRFGLKDMLVKFYVNGTFVDGTCYASSGNGTTIWDGTVSFGWAAPENGTYSLRAVFEGAANYEPCEVYVTVTATTKPLAVLFSVSSCEFEPGELLRLNATVMDASTSTRLSGYSVDVDFFDVRSDGANLSLGKVTTSTGVAIKDISYPDDGRAHAYLARVVPVYNDGKFPQGTVSSPVQLTVSKSTMLLLNVTRDYSSSKHVIQGWLKWGTSGVRDKTVKIKVDETEYSRTTNASGYFSLSLNLQPRDNKPTTYMMSASFEDDSQPISVIAWAHTLDGTCYAACTTVQYGYKPAFNSTTLTVEPQATQATQPTKTPEQMKAEAQQNGWLGVWHEWSWWYPWYRLHFVGRYNGQDVLDVGLAPLGCDVIVPYPVFNSWINDFLKAIANAYAISYITAEIAVLAAMQFGPQAFVITWLFSVGVKFGLLFAGWNSIQDLKSAFVGAWISLILGTVGTIKMLHSGLISLAFGFLEAASKVDFWKFIYKFVYIPINMALLLLTLNRLNELGGI